MDARRYVAALTLSLALPAATSAGAQMRAATLVGPLEPASSSASADPSATDFRMQTDIERWPGEVRRNGLIAAFPVDRNVEIGVGRFRVVDPARPRTNTESDRHAMAVRPRERGIAAVGVSFRF